MMVPVNAGDSEPREASDLQLHAMKAELADAIQSYLNGKPVSALSFHELPTFDLRQVRDSLEIFVSSGIFEKPLTAFAVEAIDRVYHEIDGPDFDDYNLQLMPLIAIQAVVMNWSRLQKTGVGPFKSRADEIRRLSSVYRERFEAGIYLVNAMLNEDIINEDAYLWGFNFQAENLINNSRKIAKLIVDLFDDILPKEPGRKRRDLSNPLSFLDSKDFALRVAGEAFLLRQNKDMTVRAAVRKILDDHNKNQEISDRYDALERKAVRALGHR